MNCLSPKLVSQIRRTEFRSLPEFHWSNFSWTGSEPSQLISHRNRKPFVQKDTNASSMEQKIDSTESQRKLTHTHTHTHHFMATLFLESRMNICSTKRNTVSPTLLCSMHSRPRKSDNYGWLDRRRTGLEGFSDMVPTNSRKLCHASPLCPHTPLIRISIAIQRSLLASLQKSELIRFVTIISRCNC